MMQDTEICQFNRFSLQVILVISIPILEFILAISIPILEFILAILI